MSSILKSKKEITKALIGASALISSGAVSTIMASADETTDSLGHIDVYVEHTDLDTAVKNASSAGVTIIQGDSIVKEGDDAATDANRKEAIDYYKSKTQEITTVTSKYIDDLSKYESTVNKNKQDADNANAKMNAVKTNAAANGQKSVVTTKQYVDEADVAKDIEAAQAQIANGDKLVKLDSEISSYNIQQNALTLFQTEASQGNIKINRETVKISNLNDSNAYLEKVKASYAELQEYVAKISAQSGSIPESEKPTYTLYDIIVDDSVKNAAYEPVTVYNYTPIPVTKPVTPTINYSYYEIHSMPSTSRHAENKDNEEIVEASKDNTDGKKVVQAMVNQTVSVETDNQPLPADRTDKFHSLVVNTYLPENVTVDKELSKIDTDNWTYSYDEDTRVVTFKATNKYLVQINLNQNRNNAGTVSGTMNGKFDYDAPNVFFKLDKDDTTYQVYSETIVNDEYMAKGNPITIRTDSAKPEKHNYNSQLVQIDNKPVLPGSINNYEILYNFAKYKGVNIDKEMQSKGLVLADVFPSDALELTGKITYKDPSGNVVVTSDEITKDKTSGDLKNAKGESIGKWAVVDKASTPDGLKEQLVSKDAKTDGTTDNDKVLLLTITGYDNAFYKTYVEGGIDLKVQIPMLTKKIDNTPDKQGGTYNGNVYKNVAYQSDFGNSYKSNTVENTAPTLDPKKDAVLSFANLTSLDINANKTSEIEQGSLFKYRLAGSKLPAGLSEPLTDYKLSDSMDTENDEYQGDYIVESGSAFTFKEGTALYQRYAKSGGVMPANTDITKYTTQTVTRNVSKDINTNTQTTTGADTKLTHIDIVFDADFMSQIDFSKTAFNAEAFLTTKRLTDKDGIKNVFNETINGIDFGSNEVVTNSKVNSVDDLKAKLAELSKKVDTNEISAKQFREETISALSVIIKTFSDNKTATDAAISANKSAIEANKVSIEANKTAIDANKSAIETNKSAIATNKSAIATNTSSILSLKSLVQDLASSVKANTEAVHQALSNLVIYESSVKSESDALLYATNHGVASGSIKSITKTSDGHYSVKYNTSLTGINNSAKAEVSDSEAKTIEVNSKVDTSAKPVTTSAKSTADTSAKPVTTSAKSTTVDASVKSTTSAKSTTVSDADLKASMKYEFYTLNSKDEVIAKLKTLSVMESNIVDIKQDGSRWIAYVKPSVKA